MQKIEIIKQEIKSLDSFSIDLKDFNKDGWIAKNFNVVQVDYVSSTCIVAILFEKPDAIDTEKVKQKLNEAKEKLENVNWEETCEEFIKPLEAVAKGFESILKGYEASSEKED